MHQKNYCTTSYNRIKLVWYVDLNNSNTIDEICTAKYIKMGGLDKFFLQKLINSIENAAIELESLILRNPESPCHPTAKVDDNLKTVAAIMKILNR